ncbi:MAG: hypothetical protein ACOYLB_13215 [Phototrophicaceae bacterium]
MKSPQNLATPPVEQSSPAQSIWWVRTLLLWTLLGTIIGLLAGLLYNREAQEYVQSNQGQPPAPNRAELFGLVLALIGIVRQAAELGRPEQDE